MSYQNQPEDEYWGHLALITPYNNIHIPPNWGYSTIASVRDLVLQADLNARDLILTTKNMEGRIRFSTSPTNGDDDERMTIMPNGNIGFKNSNPLNNIQIGNHLGFGEDIFNQQILFNCYINPSPNWQPKTIIAQRASMIDFSFGMVQICASGSYGQNEEIHFLEGNSPMGILIQNLGFGDNSHGLIGLGSDILPNSRVTIRGWTCDDDAFALKVMDNNYNDQHNLFTVRNDGYIGIGTDQPTEKLEIADGNMKINGDLEISGKIIFEDFSLDHWTFIQNWGLTTTGKVGIGTKKINSGSPYWTENPMLCVFGPIITTELIIVPDENNNWSDFVFNDDYILMPLDTLEKSIKEKRHLPGIPSATEVSENGIKVMEMQAKLLQKIEELTLYVIDLKKENKQLQKQINQIKNQK